MSQSIEIKLKDFPQGFKPDADELTKVATEAVEAELKKQLANHFAKTSWSLKGELARN